MGGFDVVLGNPPWERIKLQEKEWFAERRPGIANASDAAARKSLIAALEGGDPVLWRAFRDAVRGTEGETQIVTGSGLYPLCGRGDVNTYAVFAELNRKLISQTGRVGCVVPSGIATDDTTKVFFHDLIATGALASLFDFENREGMFPAADSRMKFCLLTLFGPRRPRRGAADFFFFAHRTEHLRDEERRIVLTADDIALLNPNTRTCPIFRTRADALLTRAVYSRYRVLRSEADDAENLHRFRFTRMFDMNKQRGLFETGEALRSRGGTLGPCGSVVLQATRYLPLVEGKTFDAFDHRLAVPAIREEGGIRTGSADPVTEHQHRDPAFVLPRVLYIDEGRVDSWSDGRLTRRWVLGAMDVTSATNHRTVVACVLADVATDYSVRIGVPERPDASSAAAFLGMFNSFVFDYIVRQKLQGLHFSDYISYQLPVPSPQQLVAVSQFTSKIPLELTFTAWDLEPFAIDCGYDGPPFRWDEERRFLLRCELDAAFFHLYLPTEASGEWRVASREQGNVRDETPEELAELKRHFPTPRHAVDHIMETFPIVKRKDEKAHGDYRTKLVILSIYDRMQRAISTGIPYQTLLDPPPADPRCAHPASTRPAWAVPPSRRDAYEGAEPELLQAAAPPSFEPSQGALFPGADQAASAPSQGRLDTTPTAPRRPAPAPTDVAATSPPPLAADRSPLASHLALVLDYLRTHPGPHSRSDILAATNLPDSAWPAIARAMCDHPCIDRTGEKRGTRYEWIIGGGQ